LQFENPGLSIFLMELRLQGIRTPYFQVSEFKLSPGQRVLIKGASGTGKTTFLHLLAGLYRPNEGQIHWDEKLLSDLSENQTSHIRKIKMGLVFQNLNLLSYLTAEENIELSGADKKTAQELLTQVGLSDKAKRRTQQLSLGEQQRVAVARVLAQKPEVILADEPTSSLDDKNAEHVMSLLLGNSKNQSLIMVSHDHRIEKFFDKIISIQELLR
jgi:putative ABC transport system ATP-binding protein